MTAREAAKDFIKSSVLGGTTIEQLANGMGGTCGGRYDAQIGGYIWNNFRKPNEISQKLGRFQIGVSEVEGIECLEIFSLHELHREILSEDKYGQQQSLF